MSWVCNLLTLSSRCTGDPRTTSIPMSQPPSEESLSIEGISAVRFDCGFSRLAPGASPGDDLVTEVAVRLSDPPKRQPWRRPMRWIAEHAS